LLPRFSPRSYVAMSIRIGHCPGMTCSASCVPSIGEAPAADAT
jgi:hypothetical protein